MMNRLSWQYLWLLLILWAPPHVLGQSGAGVIQGTVKDSSGAAISEASIHVVNQGTNQASDTTSNSTGFYSVPSLFTGDYTLTFSAPGMKKYVTSLTLQVGQTAVISPLLSVGSVSEQVTVAGNDIQLVTYDSQTISSTLDNARINQLPMNGRNILTLTGETTPGLESTGTRANGNLAQALEYVQDGAPLSNRNYGGPPRMPDPDTIQEVRVETANSSAEFATPGTGIITTKSGTNHLHGSLFETARNNAIGAANSRGTTPGTANPHLVRNEFGGSVGGPVILPKLYDGRDKTFFFFAYERFSLRQIVNGLNTVPTQAMRNGDFSGLINSSGLLQTLYDNQTSDPVTFARTPFLNNQIPMTRLSPMAKTLYGITPLPNLPDNPLVAANYVTPEPTIQTAPTITIRFDQNFNPNNRLYLRLTNVNYTSRTYSATPSIAGSGLGAGAAGLSYAPQKVYSGSLGYTHIFSPTFFSETVVSGEWEHDSVGGGGDDTVNYASVLGLPNNFSQGGVLPEIQVNGGFMNYNLTEFSYNGSQILTNFDENLTKTAGRHQMVFGGRYRHERLGVLPDQTAAAQTVNGMGTGLVDPTSLAAKTYGQLANTGNANADLFLGDFSNYSSTLTGKYLHYHDQEIDSYFQDNFHVNNRLTVNLGIRWEVHPAAIEKGGQDNGFDLKNKAIVLGKPISTLIAEGATTQAIITNLQNLGAVFETPQEAGLPDAMVFNSDFTFSERLGFAYSLFGKGDGTVIRGGFGRYIYPIPLRNYYSAQASNAPYAFSYNQSYTTASQSPDGQPNYILRAPQTVIAGQNSGSVVNSSGTNSILPGINQTFLNPHFPPNYVTQGNVTIEQPLKWNSVVRATYLYNHGTNLDQFYYVNNAPSQYVYETATGNAQPTGFYSSVATGPYDQTLYSNGGFVEDNRNGYSQDNALQVNYQHLYKSGYAFQIFYVYSRAFRVGGNTFRDGQIYPIADYAPGDAPISTAGLTPWAAPQSLNRAQNYHLDTATPEHHIGMNGIVDLPIGRGKRFFSNVNRFMDELIGGYQIAGDAAIVSSYIQPTASNWGATNPTSLGSINPLHVYKHKYKINDCSASTATQTVCHPGYEWFNGYIAPFTLSSPCGGVNTVNGLPSSVLPYQTPINMSPGTITCNGTTPKVSNAQYLSNNVPVTLSNGKTSYIAYAPGPSGSSSYPNNDILNPYAHTYIRGPFNYAPDLSVFKVFPITQTVYFRVNVDAFNAFNIQGAPAPSATTGLQEFTSSANTPRQIQITARLTF